MTNKKSDKKTCNKNKLNLYLPPLKRRDFLRGSAGGMAGAMLANWPWQKLVAQQDLNPATDDWDAGILRHLLPAVNESRILIKASFTRALNDTPRLRIQNAGSTKIVEGYVNDTSGEFWQFYADELQADTEYELTLQDSSGNFLCASWPLSTFPAPDQNPENVRVLF
ncbi:MAG: twin-arginine translocation signal domain-containing protein [OM182 bacterium]|nr:twin-arginine translocation signal domain-containing protein [OM182 bacterium]